MNNTEQVICNLIAASLSGRKPDLPDVVDWDDVFHEAQQQAVSGIVISAAPAEIQKKRKGDFYQIVAVSTRNLFEQNQLVSLFEDVGLPIVIIKGFAAAMYYPDPMLRSMGDIDFIVPRDQLDRAFELMQQNGYVVIHQQEGAQARHIEFEKNGMTFELHHRFSFYDLDIEKVLTDGMSRMESGTVKDSAFPMLPPLANGLVLLAHMRHHLKTGLGLRQVIDWMMYCDKELSDAFWEQEFKLAAENAGLDTLAITATRMCQLYLGLSEDLTWCSGASEELCSRLLKSLFSSGDFGKKKGRGWPIEAVRARIKREGLFVCLQRAGEHNWKLYRKHRWLKPLCPAYQIFRYAWRTLRTGIGTKVFSVMDSSDKNVELLKDLGI